MLKLALLGKPKIELSGRPVEISSRKGLALFCYLAAGDRAYSRSQLAGLFWAEKTETQARRNLRVALTKLRRQVGDFIDADRTSVGFARHHPHWLDIAQLSEAHAAIVPAQDNASAGALADARVAVEVVRGPFLEDLPLPDASAFELWLLGEREHYRTLTRELLLALATHDLERGQYTQGLDAARRLVALDPWQEDAQRWLIRFLALNGQRAAALAQFESCKQILAEELGVEPSAETEALVEAVQAGRVHAGSRPAPVEAIAHNLPALATSFVGRRRELAQIQALLADGTCRLLVLLGPGGIGKSRLAQEAARNYLDPATSSFPDGVFFVALADVERPSGLEPAIAGAMGLSLRGARPPLEQLQAALRRQQVLLVLDNFEHLATRAGLLLDLLQQAPDLKLLVTSRQRLPLLEAWNFDLEGLAVPPEAGTGDPAAYGAVRLFVERARRISLGFELAAEAEAVERICRLVDGMPLALELAAAWTRGLSCRVIAEHITTDADRLALASPSLPARQRSLEAVFAHSWELLSGEEQSVFAALSVFRGGFTLAAAGAVAGATRRHLLSLVDKSLVRRLPSGRYDLHPLLRRQAAGQLPAGRLAALQTAHARTFARFLAEREGFREGEEAPAALEEIAQELDNVRAAWQQATAAPDLFLLEQMMEPLSQLYDIRGYFAEGLARLEEATGAAEAGSVLWARLRYRQARFAFRLGRNPLAAQLGEAALPVLAASGQVRDEAGCLLCLGNVVRDMGDHTAARDYFRRSATLFARVGDDLGEASAANNLGVVHYYEDDIRGAIRHFEAALRARQRAGVADTVTELGNVGLCYAELGDHEQAVAYLEQSLARAQRLGSQLAIGLAHHNLGNAFRNEGSAKTALSHLEKGIALFRELDSQDALAAALTDLASTLVMLEQFDLAQEALQEGMALEKALERPRGIAYKHLGLGNLNLARGEEGRARAQFKAALAGEPEEVGADLLLSALLGLAVAAFRSGSDRGAGPIIASIAAHPRASYETKQAAAQWSERLGLSPAGRGEPMTLAALLAWAGNG